VGIFVFVSAGHNIVWPLAVNIISSKARISFRMRTQNDVMANTINDVFTSSKNDMMLRINDVTPYGVNDVALCANELIPRHFLTR